MKVLESMVQAIRPIPLLLHIFVSVSHSYLIGIVIGTCSVAIESPGVLLLSS